MICAHCLGPGSDSNRSRSGRTRRGENRREEIQTSQTENCSFIVSGTLFLNPAFVISHPKELEKRGT